MSSDKVAYQTIKVLKLFIEHRSLTSKKLGEMIGVGAPHARRYIASIKGMKPSPIYVSGWVPPTGKGRWEPIYSVGPKPDVELLKAQREQQAQERKLERQQEAAKAPVFEKQSWFSSIA